MNSTQGHVLVVYDEESIRRLLDRLLSARNYSVSLAGTLSEAIETLKSTPIDVVLLDVQLGERETGLQLLREVRRHATTVRLPVIILTGLKLEEADEEQIRAEGAYVFYKPIDANALLAYVDRLAHDRPAS